MYESTSIFLAIAKEHTSEDLGCPSSGQNMVKSHLIAALCELVPCHIQLVPFLCHFQPLKHFELATDD